MGLKSVLNCVNGNKKMTRVATHVCVCVCGGLNHELYHKVQQRLRSCTKVLVFKGMHIKHDICTTAVRTLVHTSRRNVHRTPVEY